MAEAIKNLETDQALESEIKKQLKTSIAPSIFNDAMGPVMRGPSSSHCAAGHRIGSLCLDLLDGQITSLSAEYQKDSALANTHSGQGTDMGLYSGILGYAIDDDRMQYFAEGLTKSKIKVEVKYLDYGAEHPNNYRLIIENDNEQHILEAISTGGGMIEVQKIDGAKVCMAGDYYELLVYFEGDSKKLESYLAEALDFEFLEVHKSDTAQFIEIKSTVDFATSFLDELKARSNVKSVKVLNPVLPTLARKNLEVPFMTSEEMFAYSQDKNLELWELALEYESARGNISKDEVFEKMRKLVRIWSKSIQSGVEGTEFTDRILTAQAPKLKKTIEANPSFDHLGNRMSLCVSAMMDVKSSMGLLIAAPTAGSCGALPGAIFGFASYQSAATFGPDYFDNLPEDEIVKAMLAAGLIGVFIAAYSTFAAEVGGCMSETGAGGAMAAAGLTHFLGGNLEQAIDASARALQNSFGLACDMIADRVEFPCMGKNIAAAQNALSSAETSVAGFNNLIPLDQVIDTMWLTAMDMPDSLCCTGKGGLAIAPRAQEILKTIT